MTAYRMSSIRPLVRSCTGPPSTKKKIIFHESSSGLTTPKRRDLSYVLQRSRQEWGRISPLKTSKASTMNQNNPFCNSMFLRSLSTSASKFDHSSKVQNQSYQQHEYRRLSSYPASSPLLQAGLIGTAEKQPQNRVLNQQPTRTFHVGRILAEEEMSDKEKKKALKAKAKEAMAAADKEEEGGDDRKTEGEVKTETTEAKEEAKEDSTPPTEETAKEAAPANESSEQTSDSAENEGGKEEPTEKKPPPEFVVSEVARDAAEHRAGLEDPTRPGHLNPLQYNHPENTKEYREDFDSEEEFQASMRKIPALERPDGTVPHPHHIQDLADECLHLTMLEMNELKNLLHDHYGFDETDLGSDGGGGGDDDDEDDKAGEAAPAEEKTTFDVKLVGFDAKSKIKIIKEVRALAGLGLKEAKEVVEKVPSVIQKGINKQTAEEVKAKMEELGAQVEIE